MNSPNKEQFERSASQGSGNRVRARPPALAEGFRFLLDWRTRSRSGYFVVTGLFTLIIGAIIGTPVLSYSGFCLGQGRFLSEQEFFDIAILRIMSLRCYQSPTSQCVAPIQYKDVDDFRARNPNCCRFVRHNSDFAGSGIVTFSQELFGNAARSVLVNFKINYVDADGNPQDTIGHGLIVVGNCGNLVNRGH
jgi:hypothetical protein